ncbi:WD repeat-containing protein 35, partial [Durusdinium trenchii]
VSVAYVSTAEVWVDSAVDWTLDGLAKACARYHYWITACSVIKFTANNARFVLVVRLGSEENATKAANTSALGSLEKNDFLEYHSVWDLLRSKRPSGEARRLKRLTPLLTLVRGQTLLHEPGFLVLRPMLEQVICCTYNDAVVHNEIVRQGAQAVKSSAVDMEILRSCRTLALMEDCGPVTWSQRWKELAMRWIEVHLEQILANDALLLLLMEASQLEAFQDLCRQLQAAGAGCTLTAFSFIHGARRWGFALLAATWASFLSESVGSLRCVATFEAAKDALPSSSGLGSRSS